MVDMTLQDAEAVANLYGRPIEVDPEALRKMSPNETHAQFEFWNNTN